MKRIAVFSLLLFIILSGLPAQTSSLDAGMTSTQFDMTGFPQWTKDLRRINIISFGVFPFAYLLSNIAYDTYRCASNGWDRRYAPWPAKGAGAIEQNQGEKLTVIGIAAGTAVCIALIDYGIVRYKRNRVEREIKGYPPGTPIMIRRSLQGEQGESSGPGNP